MALAMLVLSACEFRELSSPSNVSYVRVYLNDTEVTNLNTGIFNPEFVQPGFQRPEIVRVALYDTQTGSQVAERYLRNQGDDAQGHYYEGFIVAEPGTYMLRAYNFGTESTLIGEEYNWYNAYAYTNKVAESLTSKYKGVTRVTDGSEAAEKPLPDYPIRWDADPLFVANSTDVTIRPHFGIDTLKNAQGKPWFKAESIVKLYYLQVGVSGVDYISGSVALLTGMASAVHLENLEYRDSEPATLYLEMKTGAYPDGAYKGLKDYHCIYCTFGTFGRLPDAESVLQVAFEFSTTYGEVFEVSMDVVPAFLDSQALDHQWLFIDKVINIPAPPPGEGGGGLAPSVEDWGDVNSEIVI